jgi:tetratricopeptide (TPR) repeat protein
LPYDLWEIAYLMALLRRYFPPALFFRLLEEEGKNSAMVSRALDMLSAQGVIDFAEDPQPRIYDFFNTAEEHLNAGLFGAQARIRSLVRNRLLAWVSAGKLRPSFNLLQILADMGAIGSDELILDAVRKDLINGTGASLSAAVNGPLLKEAAGTAHLPALLFIIKTLDKLLRGDEEAVRSAFRASPPEEEGFIYKVQILANMASYQLGIHDPAAALELVKQSMLISQRLPNGRGLAQVYRLFSLVHLSKGQLEDSIDYSNFALEHAEKFQDFDEFILAAYYAAGAQFLFGNIAHAERLALRAEETALYAGLPDWANRSRFLRGKFCFESGRYEDAQKILKALLDNPYGPLSPEAENTLCAWIYRSAVFLQAERPRKPQRLTGDAFLFAIEDSYLAEDYHRTVGLSTAHLEELQDREFRFIERPDWQSGFAQEEFFLFPRKEFLSRMISVYRALALSQIGGSGREEALQSIQRIVLDGRLSDTDPNGAFYFYAHYRILGESGAPEVDMNTAISMAFKRLQRRASRIDDVEINRTFLSQHYWNSSLSLAAKEHKLI